MSGPRVCRGVALAAMIVFAGGALFGQESSVQPRLGKYTVTFFSGFTRSPNALHELELLPDFKYKVSTPGGGKFLSEGTYSVDDKGNVKWLSGLYKDEKYGGSFQVDGTRHQLHMKDRVYARNQPKE